MVSQNLALEQCCEIELDVEEHRVPDKCWRSNKVRRWEVLIEAQKSGSAYQSVVGSTDDLRWC